MIYGIRFLKSNKEINILVLGKYLNDIISMLEIDKTVSSYTVADTHGSIMTPNLFGTGDVPKWKSKLYLE
jgi:hypothetical protein